MSIPVSMPSDAIPPYNPKAPTRVCLEFTAVFVPILPLPRVECRYTLCFDVTNPSSTGTVILGTGTVTWTDTTPSNPVLTSS